MSNETPAPTATTCHQRRIAGTSSGRRKPKGANSSTLPNNSASVSSGVYFTS
jgi:hypothetical protein